MRDRRIVGAVCLYGMKAGRLRCVQSLVFYAIIFLECNYIFGFMRWQTFISTVITNKYLKAGCPMHKSSDPRAIAAAKATQTPSLSTSSSSCTYLSNQQNKPANQTDAQESLLSRLNPLNRMPAFISQDRAAGQTIVLPRERELSSIPKGRPNFVDDSSDGSGGDDTGNWEYPSPQQMYNAMLRKGYTDTPEDAVESMVAVHNFLNEGAWAEIIEWERRFGQGLWRGWQECRQGEDVDSIQRHQNQPVSNSSSSSSTNTLDSESDIDITPRLIRFTGRPDTRTPKATILQYLAWIAPSRFGTEPPFDRHDWFVQRTQPDGRTAEVRYVIDYYSAPPEPTGEPVFYLDVRPAVDTPSAAAARVMRWGGDVWWRASGGRARENWRVSESD